MVIAFHLGSLRARLHVKSTFLTRYLPFYFTDLIILVSVAAESHHMSVAVLFDFVRTPARLHPTSSSSGEAEALDSTQSAKVPEVSKVADLRPRASLKLLLACEFEVEYWKEVKVKVESESEVENFLPPSS